MNLKEKIKKILPISIYVYITTLKAVHKIRKLKKKIKILDILELKKIKNSDTLFILASGKSINLITDEEWKKIGGHDTIGMNFWFYHNFIPKIYVYEESLDKERNEVFYKNLERKKELYKNTLFIVKSLENGLTFNKVPKILLNNFRISNEIEGLYYSFDIIRKFFLIMSKKNKIFQLRGSVTYLLSLGYLMGYKNIVLCGVDLDSIDYFYEIPKYKEYELPKNNMKNIHLTEEKRENKLPISDIIIALNEEFKRKNIKLYIAKNIGMLKGKIDVYNFENCE